ncbi:4-carboxymuconolactone decarboxylase [Salinibacterium sp. M195]|nr:4-carboxymuconolactone decarboxylase [Salinibacterium sp. M195]QYH35462.1 4-carboxymuconolactone decarboxylase [Salinibacterium sp. M195]
MSTELFDRGMANRRAVLGDAHVDRSIASATEFSQELIEHVTKYCWGDIWDRPGLARRDRSIANLAMLTALNRGHELKVHVRGAINNGVTPDEIKEVLLQTAIYCGVPAAMESFRLAGEVIEQMAKE